MQKTQAIKRKRKRKIITHAAVHVQATYNNTVVTLADLNGNAIAWASAGMAGFKGPKKSTPFAAGVIVRNLLERTKDIGLKEVDVFVKGVGSGRESAIRALSAAGISILSIKDVTPIPHNGPRPPKPRRV